MAQENIPQQGAAQNVPAVQKAPQGLDATGNFVYYVRQEENRHSEVITDKINEHFERFGAGFVSFFNGIVGKAEELVTKTFPSDSLAGAAVKHISEYWDLKIAGQKADLAHQEALDQSMLLDKQIELTKQQNRQLQLQKEQTEAEAEKAQAEARVSERFDSLKDRFKSFEDRLSNNNTTTTAGPCPAQPERKLTKNA